MQHNSGFNKIDQAKKVAVTKKTCEELQDWAIDSNQMRNAVGKTSKCQNQNGLQHYPNYSEQKSTALESVFAHCLYAMVLMQFAALIGAMI